jgi:phosphoserine phosphatase
MLHIIDMDGTLLLDTTASLLIAEASNSTDQLLALEEQFSSGGLTTADFARAIYSLWHDLDSATVRQAFVSAPWIGQVKEVVDDIARRNERSLVITMSPNFFADLLLERGFDAVLASEFPSLPFQEELEASRILTPDDKPKLVSQYCAHNGIDPHRCVAYGDSMSDEPLFARLSHTVAINAGPALQRHSAASYSGTSLWQAYQLGRRLLGRTPQVPLEATADDRTHGRTHPNDLGGGDRS